jgi:flagellar biosynthesis/type III secretory pathway chaperone
MSYFQELNTLLRQGRNLVETLLPLLNQQHEVLKSRQHQALSELIAPQEQLLGQIMQVEHQLHSLLQQQQLPMNQSGMQQLILRSADNERVILNENWQKFSEPLNACRQQIKVQERVLYRNRQTIKTLLSLLKGQIKPHSSVYQANGQAKRLMSAQLIAEA